MSRLPETTLSSVMSNVRVENKELCDLAKDLLVHQGCTVAEAFRRAREFLKVRSERNDGAIAEANRRWEALTSAKSAA